MFHIALYEPEIPPNAGNVARLCAATGSVLHFIGRLGFRLDDKTLKRAGLDYWPHVKWKRHETWDDFVSVFANSSPSPLTPLPDSRRILAAKPQTDSSGERGTIWLVDNPAPTTYTKVKYSPGDCLVFGRESTGLPESIRSAYPGRQIGIPMPTGHVRSLNLATSVGIVLYEALRQQHDW